MPTHTKGGNRAAANYRARAVEAAPLKDAFLKGIELVRGGETPGRAAAQCGVTEAALRTALKAAGVAIRRRTLGLGLTTPERDALIERMYVEEKRSLDAVAALSELKAETVMSILQARGVLIREPRAQRPKSPKITVIRQRREALEPQRYVCDMDKRSEGGVAKRPKARAS